MRYSKSSLLTIALAFAFSTFELSATANAQDSNQDFPWRAENSVMTAGKSVKASLATPERDLTTSETIATPTPSFESMPSVIYDEGKKFVRQGDTYVESSDVVAGSNVGQNYTSNARNYTSEMPSAKKSSLFQKTKDLTGRLNPFSKSMRSPTAYRSSDWKVPSFSQSLPSFSRKSNDPITFAAATPLPAKTSVPESLDSVPTMLASKESYKAPALSLPARDSQFKSALPTETKLTSVFPTETQVTSAFPEKTKSISAFPAETKSDSALPTETKMITSAVGESTSGFTANYSPAVEALLKVSQDVSVIEATPVKTPVQTSAKRPVQTSADRPVQASAKRPVQTAPKRPVRTASLSVDSEFWSPQR